MSFTPGPRPPVRRLRAKHQPLVTCSVVPRWCPPARRARAVRAMRASGWAGQEALGRRRALTGLSEVFARPGGHRRPPVKLTAGYCVLDVCTRRRRASRGSRAMMPIRSLLSMAEHHARTSSAGKERAGNNFPVWLRYGIKPVARSAASRRAAWTPTHRKSSG